MENRKYSRMVDRMKKAIILYASHKATDPTSQPIRVGNSVIWIRVEDVETLDLIDALSYAECLPTEIVLNTINKTVIKGGYND